MWCTFSYQGHKGKENEFLKLLYIHFLAQYVTALNEQECSKTIRQIFQLEFELWNDISLAKRKSGLFH